MSQRAKAQHISGPSNPGDWLDLDQDLTFGRFMEDIYHIFDRCELFIILQLKSMIKTVLSHDVKEHYQRHL